ncbi:MAG: CPBP family intramembrane glutamic endopeptidase [Candidatus Heimdallarchaeota archaeon]
MGSTKTRKKQQELNTTWLSEHPWMGIMTLLFLYIIFLILPGMIYRLAVTYTYYSTHIYWIHIVDFFGVAILFLLIVPLVLGLPTNRSYKDNAESSRVFNFKPVYRTVGLGIISAVILLACMLLASYLAIVTTSQGFLPFDPSYLVDPSTVNIYTSLKPGIWEEVAFRGIILVLLLKKYSKRTAIIVNGVLFGLFHVVNLILAFVNAIVFSVSIPEELPIMVIFQIVYTMFFGFFLAYLFIKANSLIPCIIAHYLVDAFSTLVGVAGYNIYITDNLLILLAYVTVIGFGILPMILNNLLVRVSCYAWPQSFDEQIRLFDTFLARKKYRS